ncbi:MAG TPA: hypothetical protein PKA58_15225 [Polyangium sp.]|nr:hypothetical protein [Polyangium sp.]
MNAYARHMRLSPAALPLVFTVVLATAHCGSEVIIDSNDSTPHADAGVDVQVEPVAEAGVDAAEEAGPPPSPYCHCPNGPTCTKPLECCSVVGKCENPANFNCTGSAIVCP